MPQVALEQGCRADRAGLCRNTIRDYEKARHDLQPGSAQRFIAVLHDAGIELLPPGIGPGPRQARIA